MKDLKRYQPKAKAETVIRSIVITIEQDAFVRANTVNLSHLVRDVLSSLIKKGKG